MSPNPARKAAQKVFCFFNSHHRNSCSGYVTWRLVARSLKFCRVLRGIEILCGFDVARIAAGVSAVDGKAAFDDAVSNFAAARAHIGVEFNHKPLGDVQEGGCRVQKDVVLSAFNVALQKVELLNIVAIQDLVHAVHVLRAC